MIGRRAIGYVAAILVVSATFLIGHASTAAAWDNNREGGQAYAAAWCAGPNSSSYGYNAVADFLWPSAADGGTVIEAYQGDDYATLRVNVTGRFCSGFTESYAWSDYVSDGGVNGRFTYNNAAPNKQFDDSQLRSMYIGGWDPGVHYICVYATTYMPGGVYQEPTPRQCAYLTLVIKTRWNINGQSYVKRSTDGGWSQGTITARLGETVYWGHDMRNVGPNDMDRDVRYNVDKSGYTGGDGWLNGNVQPTGTARGVLNELFVRKFGPGDSSRLVKTITQDDVGAGVTRTDPVCQRIAWQDGRWDAPGQWFASNWACVRVPYEFKLQPSVAPITSAAEPGTTIGPITPSVANAGPTKSYDNTRWELSRFVVNPGATKPVAADNRTAPCTYYGGGCKTVQSGNQTFMPGETPIGQIPSDKVDDLPLGAQLCFALSVTGYDQNHLPGDGWWRHGDPQCIKVGKKPKVQIQGHDVAVRGTIDTSTTTKDTTTFGSWVEYGAFSTSATSQFASGAGLMNKAAGPAQAAWSKLTFANSAVPTSCGTQFGCYTSSDNFRPLPGIAAYFSAMQKAPYNPGDSLDGNAVATGGPITVKTAGDLTLDKQTLGKGKTLVIVASGTVTITGDLTYANGAMAKMTELPQLVVIAKNINIEDRVQTVDAWLVTSDLVNGAVNTCSNVVPTGSKTSLTGKICDAPLTIHGPVVAGKLLLNRTAGSGTGDASGDPAETISLRPDAFLWARLVAGGAGKAETVSTVELPPRF